MILDIPQSHGLLDLRELNNSHCLSLCPVFEYSADKCANN